VGNLVASSSPSDELLEDIDPMGGTLVVFDSVTLPHEVLATKNRERWAASGWMHEDQQPGPVINVNT
jgi:Rps23 Pro-64 3,4-dihydroxylase Tpa1-like proline 4-hydroxylase